MSHSNHLVRMVYASKATFKPFETNQGVDVSVAKILATARRRNKHNQLVGALYYGNGCFFQCLEGTPAAVDELYACLQQDPRHKQLKVLQLKPIDRVGFQSWEMKFAMIDREVRQFLRDHNMIKFDPYRFDHQMIDRLVAVLHQAEERAPEQALAPIMDNIEQLEEQQQRYYRKQQVLVNIAASLLIALPLVLYSQLF